MHGPMAQWPLQFAGMIGGVPVGMQMPGQGGMLALPSAQVSWPTAKAAEAGKSHWT
jgi:hypothetical protein